MFADRCVPAPAPRAGPPPHPAPAARRRTATPAPSRVVDRVRGDTVTPRVCRVLAFTQYQILNVSSRRTARQESLASVATLILLRHTSISRLVRFERPERSSPCRR